MIGIDFGNEFMKVALVGEGKTLVIIENTTTKRKTESMISFHVKERKYEADAASKRTKNPRNTFSFLNKFLGKLASD